MLDISQVREFLIQPSLKAIEAYSEDAEELLVATMAQESLGGTYIIQQHGPAVGIFQMEPNTYNDHWTNYLARFPSFKKLILDSNGYVAQPQAGEMIYNLRFAAQMCRVHYMRVKENLPKSNDINGIWNYYKQFYNSAAGGATVGSFMKNYQAFTKKTITH